MGRPVIALVLGHRLSSQGAVNAHDVSEWAWNATLIADVQAALERYGVECRSYERPNRRGGLRDLVEILNRDGVAAVVSFHFNSLSGSAATGTETLCHPRSVRGRDLATAVQRSMVACLGLADRGIKPTEVNGAGARLRILTDTAAPAVIVESYFGSNAQDTEVATARLGDGTLGQALALGIVEGYE